MTQLFASGRIVDMIALLMLAEGVGLTAWRWRTGTGLAPLDLVLNMLAGLFLLFALRAALIDAWWGWVAACLAGALVAHAADLSRRWRP